MGFEREHDSVWLLDGAVEPNFSFLFAIPIGDLLQPFVAVLFDALCFPKCTYRLVRLFVGGDAQGHEWVVFHVLSLHSMESGSEVEDAAFVREPDRSDSWFTFRVRCR